MDEIERQYKAERVEDSNATTPLIAPQPGGGGNPVPF
jgi:hypothetical protein